MEKADDDIRKDKDIEKTEDDERKFVGFCASFSLTEREQEVLKILLTSDENVQDIAEQLFISRAALYRPS